MPELSAVPLSLADRGGNLRSSNKAALGKILQEGESFETLPTTKHKSCTIIDGHALVQAIGKPASSTTFGDLADVFCDAVFSHFQKGCLRVDVAFDRYRESSIKSNTRSKRAGTGKYIRCNINSRSVPLPANWKQFIDLSDNKSNLAAFLSEQIMIKSRHTLTNCELITAGGFAEETAAESSQGSDVHLLQSTHEEADRHMHNTTCPCSL